MTLYADAAALWPHGFALPTVNTDSEDSMYSRMIENLRQDQNSPTFEFTAMMQGFSFQDLGYIRRSHMADYAEFRNTLYHSYPDDFGM